MDILSEKREGILRLEFNRLAKKNAITASMYAALADALGEAEADRDVRVIVIAGKPEIFTAGNDLEDFMKGPPEADDSPVFRFLRALCAAEKPLIGVVSGKAVGIGTTLLLHCDLVYASDTAQFLLPFVSLGLVPEAASSLLLPKVMGHARAAEMLLLGETLDAARALEFGLVTRVLPVAALEEHAMAAARRLVALPAGAIRATKRLMRGLERPAIEARMAAEGEEFRARLSSPEAREAFTAFFERRQPDFSRFE